MRHRNDDWNANLETLVVAIYHFLSHFRIAEISVNNLRNIECLQIFFYLFGNFKLFRNFEGFQFLNFCFDKPRKVEVFWCWENGNFLAWQWCGTHYCLHFNAVMLYYVKVPRLSVKSLYLSILQTWFLMIKFCFYCTILSLLACYTKCKWNFIQIV